MIGNLKRMAAPFILRTLRSFVGGWNYEIRRRPRALMGSSERELMPSLSLVLAHHLQQKQDLTFLQIGAFDGRQNDPLYQFITRYHWRGVLVEPMPDAFAKLQEAYRDEPQVSFKTSPSISQRHQRAVSLAARRQGVAGMGRAAGVIQSRRCIASSRTDSEYC